MFAGYIILSLMTGSVISKTLTTTDWPTFVPRPDGCSEPWESMPYSIGTTKGCFLFMEYRLKWDHARNVCKRLGGDLIILDTESKRKDILNFMESKGYRNGNGWSHGMWHVGASNGWGYWEWVNGHHVKEGWRKHEFPGEPKYYSGYDMCMYLYTDPKPYRDYEMLASYKCKEERYFICEKAMNRH